MHGNGRRVEMSLGAAWIGAVWLRAVCLGAAWIGAVWLGAVVATIAVAEVAPSRAPETLPDEIRIVVALEAQPTEIRLAHAFDYRQLLLTAVLSSGERIDVTRIAQWQAPPNVASISPAGQVRPVADGQGVLVGQLGNQHIEVPVVVAGAAVEYPVSFVRDVMPTMSKMGCNAGTCHGAAQGKNGFKLSLRGYDPLADHRALTDDMEGRRFNRAAPDQSLMLLKPSGVVPHVGGVLSRPGEPYYELLRAWIARGVALDLDAPRVTKVELLPHDPLLPLEGMKQQMVVLATYADGTVRDVTAEAFVESSQNEIVEIDKSGLAKAVRRGEAAMLARFEGAYAASTITVMGDRRGFQWTNAEAHNFIDELVFDKLKRLKILPSELASDADFLRRVTLDLTGLPPEPEAVRAFLADPRAGRVKRDEVIDRLIGSDDFVEYWTNKWSDLLQVNRKFLSEKGAWALRSWIREAVRHNMPYDDFVREVLTASGSTFANPPAAYLRVLREPELAMENSTQLFLGVRFNCNKCHDHPFERWTQDQYYRLAAYFAQVGRKPGGSPDEEVVFDTRGAGELIHPTSGKVVAPAFPYSHTGAQDELSNRREQFADWATSPENPYFAKSYVNRLWAYLLGVGLIEPIDDLRAGNPPSNPALLDRLAREFMEHQFDVRHMLRTICQSRVYQQTLETNSWNADDELNFSHALARRLPAETLYDTVQRVAGVSAKLPGLPAGYRAAQLPDSQVSLPGGFLDLFGRPPRESACECERSSGVVLGQALNLVNGPTIADAIAAPGNRIERLVGQFADDAPLVDELFLAVLCRLPTETEQAAGTAAVREGESRLAGAQDLVWALVNSPAFLFNH